MGTPFRFIFTTLLASFFALASHATTLHWTGAVNNQWSNAGNWSEAQVPQTGDSLVFTSGGNVVMVNDLPAGTVLATVNANPDLGFSVSGTAVEISGSTTGLPYTATLRARANISISGTILNGTLDVNGYTLSISNGTLNGPVIGSGAIHFQGYNSINGSGSFSGSMTANDFFSGSMIINGSLPSASFTTRVSTRGTGTIGPLAVGGNLSGSLHTGNFSTMPQSLDERASYSVTLSAGSYPITHVNGTVTLGTIVLFVSFASGFTPAAGQSYVLLDNDGSDAVNGVFSFSTSIGTSTPLPEGATVQYGGSTFRMTYHGGDGNDPALIAVSTATVTISSPSPNPTVFGQPVTVNATVSGASGTPTGTVTFRVNGGAVATVPYNGGQVSTTFSNMGTGTHSMTATYSGDSTYGAASSSPLSHTVTKAGTTTAVTSSKNPSSVGESVTFTATVAPVSPSTLTPRGGAIKFSIDGAPVANVDILDKNGVATYTTSSLSAGDHNIVATYDPAVPSNPDANNYTGSTSPAIVQHVLAGTTVTVGSQSAPAGQTATVNVAVSAVPPATGVPQGTVTIRNGATVLGSATLDPTGHATVSIAPLTGGTYTLTASYSGGGSFSPSSASFTFTATTVSPMIAAAALRVLEGDSGTTAAGLRVILTAPSQDPVSVSWATADDAATAGSDYAAGAGTLTFAPGETSKTILIPIIGDTTPEPDERFFVRFSNAQGAPLTMSDVPVTIVNDDAYYFTTPGAEFAAPDGSSLHADLFVPAFGNGPFPAIVAINASDWATPLPPDDLIRHEATRGYVVMAISFRSPAQAKFPAQINDVKAAVRWLRANAARFSVDPLRIGVLGRGAGAHLAELLGTTADGVLDDPSEGNAAFSSSVRSVAAISGASDLTRFTGDSCGGTAAVEQLLGCAPASCLDTARAASPVTYVGGGDDAVFLLLHDAEECFFPPLQSQLFADAIHAAGGNATFSLITGTGGEEVMNAVDSFFDRTLKASRRRSTARP
jgi:acetyl esterase/lipase